jgi:hypothetical protein
MKIYAYEAKYMKSRGTYYNISQQRWVSEKAFVQKRKNDSSNWKLKIIS